MIMSGTARNVRLFLIGAACVFVLLASFGGCGIPLTETQADVLNNQETSSLPSAGTTTAASSQVGSASAPGSEASPAPSHTDRQTVTTPSETSVSPKPEILSQLQDAMDVNDDVVGWISIPGTNIDYPVVQGRDNYYYLDHDLDRHESASGTVFMDCRSDSAALKGNIILYSHNMKNGTMFAELVKYKDIAFFHEYPLINYHTVAGITTWQIYAAYVINLNKADFAFIQTTFTQDTFREFLLISSRKSKFQNEIPIDEMDAVLTLCTCTYEFKDARLVIHARRYD
jgi:sortase B